jgi:hypothetical protein
MNATDGQPQPTTHHSRSYVLRVRFGLAAAVSAAAVAAMATPALAADGFSLQFSRSSSAVAGKSLVFMAVGKNPAWVDYQYPTYLDADVFLPSAVPTCPATESAAG